MKALLLTFRDEPLRSFELRTRPLEVGSGAGCDIVVHDPNVQERHFVVHPGHERVTVWDVRSDGPAKKLRLVPGRPLPVGADHAIHLVPDAPSEAGTGPVHTEPLLVPVDAEPARLSVIVGRGSEARRVALGARPVTIGSQEGADLVLHDRSVSGRHCRLEPVGDGVVVRDLDSSNGTWLDGVRTFVARAGAGARLRVGRTDLSIVARGEEGDARRGGLIAESSAMLEVLGRVERLASLPYRVLILGPTGCGKEEVARALHSRGSRRDGPFVALNAGGLPETLIESELFGHEKGAFTGAHASRRGVFEQADGGTLFFDEIGELPLSLQARLLRVLETHEVRRVGGEQNVPVDARVVCATHRDLNGMVERGEFREDLYYRLAELFVDVPALSARPRDIRALALHFLRRESVALGPRELTESALALMEQHDWPGNVRELRNVIRAAAAESAGLVDARDVERVLARLAGRPASSVRSSTEVRDLIESYGGNLTAAARAVGMARTTLRDRLQAELREEESDS